MNILRRILNIIADARRLGRSGMRPSVTQPTFLLRRLGQLGWLVARAFVIVVVLVLPVGHVPKNRKNLRVWLILVECARLVVARAEGLQQRLCLRQRPALSCIGCMDVRVRRNLARKRRGEAGVGVGAPLQQQGRANQPQLVQQPHHARKEV